MHQVDVHVSGKQYAIQIAEGLLAQLPEILSRTLKGKKVAVLTETNVHKLYGARFVESLCSAGLNAFAVVFPEGESHKTLQTLTELYAGLAAQSFTRSDVVLALGGGVTGDMAGLAAATFLRGTGFLQVPTSLLAMVDSSIGGKVAVDLPQGKNLVGAFYQPQAVYTDPALLDTLSNRQFANGMAELVKHGFLFNADLVRRIERDALAGGRDALRPGMSGYIAESCDCKRRVVEVDEHDNGPRQLLNFGHTLGHALEKVTGFASLAHGEAISIGMCVFSRMAEGRGWSASGTAQQVETALSALSLPTQFPDVDPEAVWQAIGLDKKARSGQITIVTLNRLGEGALRTMPLPALREALHEHLRG